MCPVAPGGGSDTDDLAPCLMSPVVTMCTLRSGRGPRAGIPPVLVRIRRRRRSGGQGQVRASHSTVSLKPIPAGWLPSPGRVGACGSRRLRRSPTSDARRGGARGEGFVLKLHPGRAGPLAEADTSAHGQGPRAWSIAERCVCLGDRAALFLSRLADVSFKHLLIPDVLTYRHGGGSSPRRVPACQCPDSSRS